MLLTKNPQRGLKYLHSANIVHCDLRPSSILITRGCDLKITGLDHSRIHGERVMTDHIYGNRDQCYQAPELMLGAQIYQPAMDMWAAGCVLADMINGAPLFSEERRTNQLYAIIRLLGYAPSDLMDGLSSGDSRPIPVDENELVPAQYITSATGVGSRGSWSKGAWPSGPSSFTPELPSQRQLREGPGINKISRAEQPKPDYHVALRELSHGAPHPKPGMPVFQGNIDQRTKHQQPHVDPSNYQAQARMALTMEPHVAFDTPKTEKEKMLAGEPYQNYSDPQLNRERERCKAALWRYNNASNPNLGIGPDERRRLLKQVLMPPPDPQAEPGSSNPVGSLGPCVVVETPFNCHFGYNINIGEDVLISENCLLADDCPINIGAHTWIGPNVTILGSMAMGSMQDRKGSRSKYQGRPVVIAEDCWIGAGATILPGVSLGRGAYIAPGEVVKQQILPYGFQGLKPNFP
ncbi:hypothetical protein ACJ72_07189 [Emergomyces africanus]|uniref:Protein kinase domain-containing protein n=1 Tax=Emergomyces africanus TaxID=1955775 RepID=A0A1B7NPF2_9EURO|nr:hypothetical protein ACJ72_07189 [Emergomyces africanus]